jgi:hypothetical protein
MGVPIKQYEQFAAVMVAEPESSTSSSHTTPTVSSRNLHQLRSCSSSLIPALRITEPSSEHSTEIKNPQAFFKRSGSSSSSNSPRSPTIVSFPDFLEISPK